MTVHDTTNIIDSSVYLKAKLDKNMVGTNYYIENLQAKRDADWDFRHNVVSIEEELFKPLEYSTEKPMYTPIDVVVTNTKNPLSDEESNGTLSLAFRNLNHPCDEGYRYRFSTSFPDMTKLTEDEKHYSTSIWLAVNHSSVKPGNSVTVKRCNTSFAMVGSPTNSLDNITEVHYEPVVLENKMKYLQQYANNFATVPQAEWYAILQCNYYSNHIKINDRFLFGTMSGGDLQAFIVKAVIKAETEHTFVRDFKDELASTPLITLALDKVASSPDDNPNTRIAANCTVYKVDDTNHHGIHEVKASGEEIIDKTTGQKGLIKVGSDYAVNFTDFAPTKGLILQGETESYSVGLFVDGDQYYADFTITAKLTDENKDYRDYCEVTQDGNSFKVKNKKAYKGGKLIVTAAAFLDGEQVATQDYEIKLGGFY